ncbi:hypothetical protein A4A49_65346 [Nicotiana attenuata]|uniref:Uncharacterized protein n=1 Tax=Nicotiana attenuata TaxID=49451 RepID=A0A1J6IW84_NICAT|nr:hypothetical protein A4A49_65346 [Nicotiana attenuata]
MWLQNCHMSMGQAREQVLRLAEKAAYVHNDHRRLNNEKAGQQARVLVPQLPTWRPRDADH